MALPGANRLNSTTKGGHQEASCFEGGFKMTGMDVCIALQNGTPSIHVDLSQAASGIISFSPACLRPEDPDAIGRRLRELIG